MDAGKAWAAAGAPQRAADAFRRAVEGAPAAAEAHLGLARALRRLGRLREARASVTRALDLEPTEPTALLLRGVLELELGDPRRAQDAFAVALSVRRLDLLPAGGGADLRRALDALAPPAEATSLFEQELRRRQAG